MFIELTRPDCERPRILINVDNIDYIDDDEDQRIIRMGQSLIVVKETYKEIYDKIRMAKKFNTHRVSLVSLISRFHPGMKDKKPEFGHPITAGAAEEACKEFRKDYEKVSIDLESQNPDHLYGLLQGTWMGIPESRSLVESLGRPFGILCDLCEGWEEMPFIEYLEQTLIPDLKVSGAEQTAVDFETCLKGLKLLQIAKNYISNCVDPNEAQSNDFNINDWEFAVVEVLRDQ